MRRRTLGLLLGQALLLLPTAVAHGQGSGQTLRPVGDLAIDSKPSSTVPVDSKAERDRPPALRLQFDSLPRDVGELRRPINDPTAFGNRDRLWEFRSGGAYELGRGLLASAQVIGRRGYRLPLYASDLIGADRSSVALANTSLVDMSQLSVDWVAKMRIEKRFVRRTWDMRLVSEAIVPLARTDQTILNPSTGVLPSRAIRFGVILGF